MADDAPVDLQERQFGKDDARVQASRLDDLLRVEGIDGERGEDPLRVALRPGSATFATGWTPRLSST